jgi:hypothetical protein
MNVWHDAEATWCILFLFPFSFADRSLLSHVHDPLLSQTGLATLPRHTPPPLQASHVAPLPDLPHHISPHASPCCIPPHPCMSPDCVISLCHPSHVPSRASPLACPPSHVPRCASPLACPPSCIPCCVSPLTHPPSHILTRPPSHVLACPPSCAPPRTPPLTRPPSCIALLHRPSHIALSASPLVHLSCIDASPSLARLHTSSGMTPFTALLWRKWRGWAHGRVSGWTGGGQK